MCSSPPKGTADASGGGKRYPAPPIPGPEEFVELSNVERVTLRLLADAIVPRTGNTWEPLGGSASDLGVADPAARALQEYQAPDIQRHFRQLLKAHDSPG